MTDERELTQIQPSSVTHPGVSLRESLEALDMTQRELCQRIDLSEKHLSEIIKGKARISPSTANRLEKAIDVPASYWLNRQGKFDEFEERTEEKAELEDHLDVLDDYPIQELFERGYVETKEKCPDLLRQLLDFFGVGSPKTLNSGDGHFAAAFRESRSYNSAEGAVSAWLRVGELRARKLDTNDFEPEEFRQALDKIRDATRFDISEFQEVMCDCSFESGVVVVLEPEFADTRIHGATQWVGSTPVIQLSLRQKNDAQLFFSFFHEAGHILHHGHQKTFVNYKSDDEQLEAQQEAEANKFASDFLIPPDEYQQFLRDHDIDYLSKAEIENFARRIGIAPGIVVGRLQHEGHAPWEHYNGLKRSVRWKNDES